MRTLAVVARGLNKREPIGRLAAELAPGASCVLIDADIGCPLAGPPGAVTLARREDETWRPVALVGLATLDAARFRLPLAAAVATLARTVTGPLLVAMASIDRGAAAFELPAALAAVADADEVVLLGPADHPLAQSTVGSGAAITRRDVPAAARWSKARRAAERDACWERYLTDGHELQVALDRVQPTGPPVGEGDWPGRQLALLARDGSTLAMGEARGVDGGRLSLVAPLTTARAPEVHAVLMRDVRRTDGVLRTIAPERVLPDAARHRSAYTIRPRAQQRADLGPPPTARFSGLSAVLVSGAFGDPLLHLRLEHEKRSLLFDLGETQRLPARIVHQVSDVFISHAHFDHIAGFLWLLRSRIGQRDSCRIYGPPGIAERIDHLARGISWDLIGDRGPRFEVFELRGAELWHHRVQANRPGPRLLHHTPVADLTIRREARFRVQAVALEHSATVLAFAVETRSKTKMAYVTDVADTEANRARIHELARGAHTLLCEAAYLQRDRDLMQARYHLTGRACGEIARAADVGQLIPFHFSKRYEREPEAVYAEIASAFSKTVLPPRIAELLQHRTAPEL